MMYRGFRIFNGGGIVGIILVLVLAYFLIKYLNENKGNINTSKRKNSALDVLNERYARGEIDEEEYKRKKKNLDDFN